MARRIPAQKQPPDFVANYQRPEYWYEQIAEAEIIRYPEPGRVLENYFDLLEAPYNMLPGGRQMRLAAFLCSELSIEPEPPLFDGANDPRVREALEASGGLWGYFETDVEPPIIHYWASENLDAERFVYFLSYQLGETVLVPLLECGPVEQTTLCGVVSAITARAWRIVSGEEKPQWAEVWENGKKKSA